MNDTTEKEIGDLLDAAKTLAIRYRRLTGKPLGITGEVAEVAAATLLGLKLAPARAAGYDAFGPDNRKIQIKGRSIPPNAKPGQRLGSIRLDHVWNTVLYVQMDDNYEVQEMWEADRASVASALTAPGSKARNERGALSANKFKQIAKRVWPK